MIAAARNNNREEHAIFQAGLSLKDYLHAHELWDTGDYISSNNLQIIGIPVCVNYCETRCDHCPPVSQYL